MNLLIFILILLITLSQSARVKETFSDIYDEAFENYNDPDNTHHLLKNSNRNCVWKKLRLDENGEKLVTKNLGLTAVRAAASLCLDDPIPAFEGVFNRKVIKIQSSGIKRDKIDCLKLKLWQLDAEGNSDILSDFDPCSIDDVEEECGETFETEKELWKVLMKYRKMDKNIGVEDCLNRNHQKKKERSMRLIVLAFTQPENEAALNDERRRALGRYKSLNQKLYDCTIENIEAEF